MAKIGESAFTGQKNAMRVVSCQNSEFFGELTQSHRSIFGSCGEEGCRYTIVNPTSICIAWHHSDIGSLEGIEHSGNPWLPAYHCEPQY